MSSAAPTPNRRRPGLGATLLIDYGPLLLFFLTNFLAPVPHEAKIYWATGVFMVAMITAMLSKSVTWMLHP